MRFIGHEPGARTHQLYYIPSGSAMAEYEPSRVGSSWLGPKSWLDQSGNPICSGIQTPIIAGTLPIWKNMRITGFGTLTIRRISKTSGAKMTLIIGRMARKAG